MFVANKEAALALPPRVVEALRAALPAVAAGTVEALTTEVPAYGPALLSAEMATTIEDAVQTALGAFLRLATQG